MRIDYKIILIVAAVIAALIFDNYKLRSSEKVLYKNLIGKAQEAKRLSDSLLLARVEYKNQKDINEEAKKVFNKETLQLINRIKVLSDATFLIKERATKTEGSKLVVSESEDGPSFVVNEVSFNDGPPIGYVLIYSDGQVISMPYQFEINVDNLVTRDEKTGRYSIINKADYILKSPSLTRGWFKKPYPLNISSSNATIDPTERVNYKRSFSFLNPKLNIGTNLESEPKLNLGISFMSYGLSQIDTSFRFLNAFVEFSEEDITLGLIPVMMRINERWLPNTFVGPSLRFNDNQINYGLGISVGL